MDLCHAHNLNRDPAATKRFGIRVTLPSRDTFARLLGTEWEHTHWYSTEVERDRAFRDMSGEHLYSRRGDRPTLRFEPIERA
jgi:hypothetical protein